MKDIYNGTVTVRPRAEINGLKRRKYRIDLPTQIMSQR